MTFTLAIVYTLLALSICCLISRILEQDKILENSQQRIREQDTLLKNSRQCVKEQETCILNKDAEMWEVQEHIVFKTNELHDMTLKCDAMVAQIGEANTWAQEVQEELDWINTLLEETQLRVNEQDVYILERNAERHEMAAQLRYTVSDIQGLDRICNAMHAGLVKMMVFSDDGTTEIIHQQAIIEQLDAELEQKQQETDAWASNNAGTIHALQSRADVLEGENAELRQENGNLALDLEAMIREVGELEAWKTARLDDEEHARTAAGKENDDIEIIWHTQETEGLGWSAETGAENEETVAWEWEWDSDIDTDAEEQIGEDTFETMTSYTTQSSPSPHTVTVMSPEVFN
ncbi:hypothetical protein EJ02DRAFT_471578 [Clathrospora elynae]|uniref:Uncharacterized protein n=1 Tax=Clathrospora elynae TaxID=706981 RepID=A0A6A5S5X2_9PLEO|nr:hypothetical protein EJ02DRAFT_471578 [Clathrospora elynae]